ncbi:hypothetical protein L227DRAFT_403249 [Lentinus tigrinus ALCF2SS1-6]|uniref:Uncharacterized protein n=1 Tax=Lentinus tigrinus ALCF2SS1-6 TaxID=1328759 RepID=A0A5C2RPN8_9APHY|nr:hypothetical protein L227DRAFT_403249 [Lentinus tigrinus ALCF2SS1-6]
MWPPSRFGTLSAYYALLPTSYLSDPAYPSPHRTPRRWLLHAPLLRSDILALHIDTDHASPTGDQVSRLAPPRGDFPSSSRSCTHLQNHAPTSRGVIDLDRVSTRVMLSRDLPPILSAISAECPHGCHRPCNLCASFGGAAHVVRQRPRVYEFLGAL